MVLMRRFLKVSSLWQKRRRRRMIPTNKDAVVVLVAVIVVFWKTSVSIPPAAIVGHLFPSISTAVFVESIFDALLCVGAFSILCCCQL